MSNDNKGNNAGKARGIDFLALLTLIFITLKLTGFISWSWWWVLAPLWIPTALVLAILAIVLIVMVVKEVVSQQTTLQATKAIDQEAAELGISRGYRETDQALAYRINKMKELTGKGRPL